MLKPKSTLHKRMLKIAIILFVLTFVLAFFFILSHILEIALLKQTHSQIYVTATYYMSIIQKWALRLIILSVEAFISFLLIWLVILIITLPFKPIKLENTNLTLLIQNTKLESEKKK